MPHCGGRLFQLICTDSTLVMDLLTGIRYYKAHILLLSQKALAELNVHVFTTLNMTTLGTHVHYIVSSFQNILLFLCVCSKNLLKTL